MRKFALSFAYQTQCLPANNLGDFKWLWKGCREPRINFFFWLVWYDRLPHCKLLTKTKITNSTLCPHCLIYEENSEHILRLCTYAVGVWDYLGYPNMLQGNFETWICGNIQSTKTFSGFRWCVVFLYLCHELWKERNGSVFRQSAPTPRVLLLPACVF